MHISYRSLEATTAPANGLGCTHSMQCTFQATSCQQCGVMCLPATGFPFIVLNTVCGSLAAYGFAGLRYTPSAIILFQVMLVLQSLARRAAPHPLRVRYAHAGMCQLFQLQLLHRPCTDLACPGVPQYCTNLR